VSGVLDGQVALVTGGSRGIGRGIAEELAKCGATIAVNYNSNEAAANEVVSTIEQAGGKAKAYQADVSDYDAVQAMCKQVIEDLGPVRILINNAGATADRTLSRMTLEEWRKVISVNVDSLFNVTSAVWNQMGEAGGGSIICISSVVGETGRLGLVNYGTAKAAALGFMRGAAREGARFGIRVNAVAPGFVETDMIANLSDSARERLLTEILLGRLGEVQDVASLVRYIVTEGHWITGQTFNVNGGMHIA